MAGAGELGARGRVLNHEPRRKPTGRARGVAIVTAAGVSACVAAWLYARLGPGPAVERATIASVALVPIWTGMALLGRAGAGHARRRLFTLHRRLGAALAIVAMLVFGSGVGAVLDRTLTSWQVPDSARSVNDSVEPASEQALDESLATLIRAYPELEQGQVSIHPASAAKPWIQADFLDAERTHRRVDLDPATGEITATGEPPLGLVREFHRHLLVTEILGESILGFVGLCLGLVLLSGLATRKWLRTGARGQVRTPRPRAMNLHQWLGFGLLPAALLSAGTGAMLGLTLVIVPIVGGAAYQGDRAALMHDVLAVDRPPLVAERGPTPNLKALAQRRCPQLREALPDARVHEMNIRHPGRANGVVRVKFERPGWLARGSMTIAADGSLRDCRALPAAGIGMQSFMAVVVLHYGEWGDPHELVDIAYLILGSALFAVAWLGGSLLARRRERDGDRKASRRLSRWLTGVGLGLILITAELALLSRFPALSREPNSALVLVGLTVLLITIRIATGDPRARAKELLIVLAVTLASLAPAGLIVAGVTPGWGEGLAALGAIALCIGVRKRVIRERKTRESGPEAV